MKPNDFKELNKSEAIKIQKNALEAIRVLHDVLQVKADLSNSDFETLKRAVGLTIIKIDENILAPVYSIFPELDDLKNS
jgi:hypothetical protein